MSHYGILIRPDGFENFNGSLDDIFLDVGRNDDNSFTITHAKVTTLSPDGALRIKLINEKKQVSYEYIVKPENRADTNPGRIQLP